MNIETGELVDIFSGLDLAEMTAEQMQKRIDDAESAGFIPLPDNLQVAARKQMECGRDVPLAQALNPNERRLMRYRRKQINRKCKIKSPSEWWR